MSAKRQVRMTVWIDADEHKRFTNLFPSHGAFTRIMRTLLIRHMERVEKQGERLLEEKMDGQ